MVVEVRRKSEGPGVRHRPPILFAMVYGAGLATGLLRLGAPGWVAGMSLAAGLLVRRPLTPILCAALLLGRVSGELAWLGEGRSCFARLPAGSVRLLVRLLEPVDQKGGRVEVQPLRSGCSRRVLAWWPQRHASVAGLVLRVEGRWIPQSGRFGRPGGTLVIVNLHDLPSQPSPAARLRTGLSRASQTLY